MPAYISHLIMGDRAFKEMEENGMFYTDVKVNTFKTFSLGADLSAFSSSSFSSHNKYTAEFFLRMISYIKENKLYNDEKVMAMLYGHMAHYYLDCNCHPLIYYFDKGLEKNGILSNHTLIEGLYSSFLSSSILHEDNSKVIKGLDYESLDYNRVFLSSLYDKVYSDRGFYKSSKMVLKLVSVLENAISKTGIKKTLLKKYSGFLNFLKVNNVSYRDLLNLDHEEWKNPVSGEVHHESFIDLYNKSITDFLEAATVVNHYIYGDISIDVLRRLFGDISYDTGVSCSLGNEMKYCFKRHLN